ncbi:MAG TPA: LysR family transcriptional regulator [Burkholderiaceae bacterium]|nr:LysR family transcriptional regulator [Burkholderiaceae bacterium]
MNLRQLETLIWTCRLASVRKAADQLGSSQPAASARLRELEEFLGIELLARDKRPIRVSPQGREILRLAEAMVEMAERMKRHANDARPIYGTVRLGANHGVASTWLPALLRTCYERLPGVEIELVVEQTDHIRDHLKSGNLDLGFVIDRIEDNALGYCHLYDAGLEWVAGPRTTGVPDVITPAGVSRFPILTDAQGSFVHRAVVGWFRAANIQPRRVDICSGPGNRLNLVAEGDWLTVVPSAVVDSHSRVAEFCRRESNPPLDDMQMGAAWRLASDVGETVQHLLALSRLVIDEWIRAGRRVMSS